MKKKLPIICNAASAVLVIVFVIKCITDYKQYLASFGSAPYSVWILFNALYLLIPATIVFAAGFIAKKKIIKKESNSSN
ncbi:MAG: hypothetical protein IKE50_00345 [Erysipelotrichaceae bacterium]|nr:hypothetical protein [Erysipelotrichaceae bacterium]MBR2842182.1 hypothetical protein [Lachnospiraceae bacterium]